MAPSRARQDYRIGINLTWLVPGVVGGSEEYTLRLLRAVTGPLADRIQLRLYAQPELLAAHPDLAERFPVRSMPDPGFFGARSRAGRILMEQTWLAGASGDEDLIHHAGGTMPYVRRQPGIVTIHDPQPLDFPENFHPIKRRWLHHTIPYSVRAARLVLCPSHFTADRLQDLLDVPEDKLRVVVHGHSHDRDQPDRDRAEHGPSESGRATTDAARFGRFVLYPAIAYPHKRHIDVVRVLAELTGNLSDVAAVFTGRHGPELEAVMTEARRLGVSDRVHVLGRVPEAELDELYRAAVALVFPSSYEGFGNPALEAMSAGCPVVVSDAGALPEVVGGAGLVAPVGDVTAIAAAVSKIISDRSLAAELQRRGERRAADFDVAIAARRLADVYGELAESRRS